MKILVPVKRVVDYSVKIRVKADGTGVDTNNVKMSMNPFDEIALEEAVRLVEAGLAQEVVAVSMGTSANQEILRSSLARGAQRAMLIETNEQLSPLTVAKVLAKIVLQEQVQLVMLGKQAIDSDNQQVGQMLAGLLDWPQATYASKIIFQNDYLEVAREVDAGLEIVRVKLPAVITADLRLNEPRYLSLPNIMKAKQKTIETIDFNALQITPHTHIKVLDTYAPPVRKGGIMVSDVAELIDKLQNEAKVI
jgi:electron transfer flavoprotein beta subunit